MADDTSDKRRRSKKKRSSLLTWKKKFNIKKRFTNKLPLHRRHIRALMSGWSLSDVRSVLTQYEITSMLKQLSLKADQSRLPCSSLAQDLGEMFRTASCCDLLITCCAMTEQQCLMNHDAQDHAQEFLVHRNLLSYRWPHLRGVLKAKLFSQNRSSFHEAGDFDTSGDSADTRSSTNIMKIHISEIAPEKMHEMLGEVYDCLKSHPRKLLPLPTNDDSFHIRNSRGKQTYRHTILECEQPPVTRRNVPRRKHSKHRFSMDERILSKHPIATVSPHAQQVRSNEVIQPSLSQYTNEAFNPGTDDRVRKTLTERAISNSIQDDVYRMYNDAKSGSGDLKIVFSLDSSANLWMTPHVRRRDFSNHYQAWILYYESSNYFPSSTRDWQDPLYCHKVVLAARSPYFRKLIEKQMRSPTWWDSDSICTVEIDGSVILPRYMTAVLHTMYTDKVDLLRIYERTGQGGMPMSGVPVHFHLRDAMMLHHIGRFIEFPQLVYGCEEFIVSSLDQNNLLQVLQWASLPDGSEWVKRQVNNFIRERFMELPNILYELTVSQIVEVLKSDFVNASELDILKCALRWGEHELLRRIENREPNLVTHTAHSVSRSKTASARRRELISSRIEELHECTAPVLACVRMQHVLPPNHELFTNAVKRGVISRPPSDLLENINDRERCSRQWIKSRVGFIPPRLFQPYMDETRNILDERFAQENDCVSLRSMHSFSREQTWCSVRNQKDLANHGIPDALYMVGQARLPTRRRYGNRDLRLSFTPSRLEATGRKVTPTKYIGDFYPVPEISTLREMMAHEREMRSTYIVNKVLRACIDCCHNNGVTHGSTRRSALTTDEDNSLADDMDETEHCNRCSALRLVRLFVIRERGLPDCAIDLLQRPELYYTFSELRGVAVADASRNLAMMQPDRSSKLLARTELNTQEQQFREHLRNEDNKSGISQFQPQDLWRREVPASSGLNFDLAASEHNNRNIPSSVLQDVLVESSSSSSEEEAIVQVRRKRRSLSRKGSTSTTTSYQSIPDVAASANSSLQRLQRNSSHRISVTDFPNSPLVGASASGFVASSQQPNESRFFSKLTETETGDSSTSSCEENTSENDPEPDPSLYRDEPFRPDSDILNYLTPSEIPTQNFSGLNREIQPLRPHKIVPPRRPLPTDISELFASNLNFIDDHSQSSEDDNLSELLRSPRLDIPELVKDGTLPRPEPQGATAGNVYIKPDIFYPSQGEEGAVGEQCGQYFFCSLTREKMSKSKHMRSSRRSGTSFSFAINNDEHARKKSDEGEKSDDTIFL